MRCLFISVLIACVLSGCKAASKKPQAEARSKTVSARVMDAPQSSQKSSGPSVRPVDAVTGRVIAVREPLRFVIIDFPAQKLPKLDQRLAVYRLDQKVAEIKISGPYLGTTVAADITAGDVREGDLVRE